MKLANLSLVLLSIFLLSCGTNPKTDNTLKKAIKLHNGISQTVDNLAPRVEALEQKRNGIQVMGRQLTEMEMALSEKIGKAEGSFARWNKQWSALPAPNADALKAAKLSSEQYLEKLTGIKDKLSNVSELISTVEKIEI